MFFGILAFTPYYKWHNEHMQHHATVGNLDKRGVGDVWTMTREEYLSSSKWLRFRYRMYRNPLIMFGIGSLYIFVLKNRIPNKDSNRKEKLNVYFTNAALAGFTTFTTSTHGYQIINLKNATTKTLFLNRLSR